MKSTKQQPMYELLKDISTPICFVPKGTVFSENGSAFYSKYAAYTYGDSQYPLHPDTVENNPDWFRRVQPKEWEIVARISTPVFRDIPYGKIIKKGDIGWVYAELREYPIHTVRRLSDGETFSVGEFIDDGQILSFDNNERLGAIVCKTESEKRGHSRFMMNERVRKAPLPPPTPKEETVKVLQLAGGTDCKNGSFAYSFVTSSKIPDLKYQPIMNAIEDVLNEGKPKWEWPKERWVGFYDSVNANVIQLYKSIVDSQSEEIARLRKEILSFIDN